MIYSQDMDFKVTYNPKLSSDLNKDPESHLNLDEMLESMASTPRPGKQKKNKERDEEFLHKTRQRNRFTTPTELSRLRETDIKPMASVPHPITGEMVHPLEAFRGRVQKLADTPRGGRWLADDDSLIRQHHAHKRGESFSNGRKIPPLSDQETESAKREINENRRELPQLDARTKEETKWDRDNRDPKDVAERASFRVNEDSLPIRVKPPVLPESHHPLFAHFDRECSPSKPCTGLGHVVTIWNEDGGVPGLPKGVINLGVITGRSTHTPTSQGVLSEAALEKHKQLCDSRLESTDYGKTVKNEDGTTERINHNENCPFEYHRQHCGEPSTNNDQSAAYKHDDKCPLGEMTETTGEAPNRDLTHVTLFAQKPIEKTQYGKTKSDPTKFTQEKFSESDPTTADPKNKKTTYRINTTMPEWQNTGIGGAQQGISVDSARVVHVPSEAIQNGFLHTADVTGKADLRHWFDKTPEFQGRLGSRPTTATFEAHLSNPFGASGYKKLKNIQGIRGVTDQLEAREKNPDLWNEPMYNTNAEKSNTFNNKKQEEEMENVDDLLDFKPKESFVHVFDNFQQGKPCRFCDDTPNVNGKGSVVETGRAPDGRPLYAHPECDNPFAFAEEFNHYLSPKDLECTNCGAECSAPGYCGECFQSVTANSVDQEVETKTEVSNLNENGDGIPPEPPHFTTPK